MNRFLYFALVLVAVSAQAHAKPARRAAPPADATPAVRLLESRPLGTRLGNPEIQETAAGWIQEIRRTRKALDIEAFYIADWPREALRPVLEELVRAGRRGVRVRILLEARAFKTFPMPADSLRTLPNIQIEGVNFGLYTGGLLYGKFMVFDGGTVALGSADLDWRSLSHTHELGVVIRDAGVARVYADLFDMDWRVSAVHLRWQAVRDSCLVRRPAVYRVKSAGETVEIRPGYTPLGNIPDSSLDDRENVLRNLREARREIVLQTLTYATTMVGLEDTATDHEIRAAAARGVKVKLLVSDWNKQSPGVDALQALTGLPNLEVRFSVVPDWSGGYISEARSERCSYMVVDSAVAWIGSSNFEPGHFRTVRNEGVTLRSARIARQARAVFERSWTANTAEPVLKDKLYEPRRHGKTPPMGAKVFATP